MRLLDKRGAGVHVAAGGGDVFIMGGAAVIDQALSAGVVDELCLHVADVLVGGGTRLFANLGDAPPQLEQFDATVTDAAVHLGYRVTNR